MQGTEQLWVPKGDLGEWDLLPVVARTATEVTVKHGANNMIRVPIDSCARFDSSHTTDWDDVGMMGDLHEAPLIALLRGRHARDAIYTWSGDVLISVNPYHLIDGMYALPNGLLEQWKIAAAAAEEAAAAAKAEGAAPPPPPPPMPPHIFSVAERAWRLLHGVDGGPQALVVNGESGAGKTEARRMRLATSLLPSASLAWFRAPPPCDRRAGS
jgi:myosin-5